MATKTNMAAEKPRKVKSDDAVVYKVMIALALLCAALMGLRSLRAYYETVGGFSALYDLTIWIAVGGLALAVISGLAAFLIKNTVVRTVAPWVLILGLLAAVTGMSMRSSWTDGFPFLYFLCCAVLVQYIIYQLYRWEFFLFSLSTVVTGGLLLNFSGGFSWTMKNLSLLVLVLLVLAGTTAIAWNAAQNKGALVLGKKRWALFSAKFNPMLIYLVNGLWFVCTLAAVLLGGLFAYYCMFAAIAVEFIAAVYYTFQLK